MDDNNVVRYIRQTSPFIRHVLANRQHTIRRRPIRRHPIRPRAIRPRAVRQRATRQRRSWPAVHPRPPASAPRRAPLPSSVFDFDETRLRREIRARRYQNQQGANLSQVQQIQNMPTLRLRNLSQREIERINAELGEVLQNIVFFSI